MEYGLGCIATADCAMGTCDVDTCVPEPIGIWEQRGVLPDPKFSNFATAFDPTRGETLLFGGFHCCDVLYDTTWAWDGSTWTNVPARPLAMLCIRANADA